MKARIAAVAAGLLLAGTMQPVAAAPEGTITLQGSTSASTTIDVPADVTIDPRRITATGPGRFGGFYVDLRAEHNVGAVWLRDYHPADERDGHVNLLAVSSGKVPRGRHRIYLVADGPMTVRIPVTGMTSRTLRPAHRTTAAVSVERLTRGGVNGTRMSGRQPVTAAKRSVSFSSIMLEDEQAHVGTIEACLTEPGGICNSGGHDSSRYAWFVSNNGPYNFYYTIIYSPGVKAGRFDAVQGSQNFAGIKDAVGASFTLALV